MRLNMAKRKERPVNKNAVLKLLELQCAVMTHTKALKAAIQLMIDGKREAGMARLDGAVSVLDAVVRGQAAGMTIACPSCKGERPMAEWVDEHKCGSCGEYLEIPDPEGD